MAENKMLSPEEIDALFNASSSGNSADDYGGEAMSDFIEETAETETDADNFLDKGEIDALGEIGNISMGSAATTLSELLRQKVNITSPRVRLISQRELFEGFEAPYIIIQVEFTTGLDGFNILVIRLNDAMIMSNLMMGGDGLVETEEISELEISAASEAMNQMIGTASTSLATMFGRPVNISPPVTTVWSKAEKTDFMLPIGDAVVIVSFQMKIGDLVDTEIMQVLSIETAKREAALLWHNLMGTPLPEGMEFPEPPSFVETVTGEGEPWLSKDLLQDESPVPTETKQQAAPPRETAWSVPAAAQPPEPGYAPTYQPPPTQSVNLSFPGLSIVEQRKMELLLEVPLKVSVVLGRTKRPIKEVLNLTPGAIVELNSLVDEPVEVLVNGTLVAKGEVVVVNENFGVRITNIISQEDRLKQLKE
ncbi:MAG: hypothetical protein VR68_11185 [Peptococcaceae bacterium BRH_c4a]|nr:MAG: hypothetical protein VR68_11185 [Peptococcaceae bacterium BRH_c4a]